ncbi:unnamed protein product, partial [Rotaria sordida]
MVTLSNEILCIDKTGYTAR